MIPPLPRLEVDLPGGSPLQELEHHFQKATKHNCRLLEEVELFDKHLRQLRATVAKLQGRGCADRRDAAEVVELKMPDFLPEEKAREEQVMTHESVSLTISGRPSSRAPCQLSRDLTSKMDSNGPVLWPIWTEDVEVAGMPTTISSSAVSGPSRALCQVRSGDVFRSSHPMKVLMLRPASPLRLAWDLFSLLVISYDMFTMPLMAFDYEDNEFTGSMRLMANIFWTLDIFMAFVSGYNHGGIVEMRVGKVARHYLRTWFFPDILIVLTDWVFFYSSFNLTSVLNIARLGKTLRLSRMLRLLRAFRIAKFIMIIEELGDFIFSDNLVAYIRIFKLMFVLALINHFTACIWYAIGSIEEEEDIIQDRWVDRFEGTSLVYRYICAFHWSIAQFTPAPIDFHPVNFRERVFTVTLLFFGLVMFSSFLGTVTTTLTHARHRQVDRARQDDLVRRFILNNHLSLELGNRISAFVRMNASGASRKNLIEGDVPVLKSLPGSIQRLMHYEVYWPVLLTHPLFSHLGQIHDRFVRDFCHTVLRQVLVGHGSDVFCPGVQATSMYFVMTGRLAYFRPNGLPFPAAHVDPGSWHSEAALWVRGDHDFQLVANKASVLVEVDAQNFHRALKHVPAAVLLLRGYARLFLEHLTTSTDNDWLGLTFDGHDSFDTALELARRAFEGLDTTRWTEHSSPKIERQSAMSKFNRFIGRARPLGIRSAAAGTV
mmetsp:Transcript_70469/g.199861  ORF Transcript_70469/g.199861 Transcript_70469/m.199861 type:complete len:714 (-) Transcript_70469:147-2288(-)